MFDIFGTKDPQKALIRAHEYVKDGKIDAAIKVLEGNLTEGEESFDLYLELARLYFDIEQRGKVVELLRHTKAIMPARTDEIIALISTLFERHASIDLGDFLIQTYVEKEEFSQISKILKDLSERDITLLLTRYEKLKQSIENKNIIAKKDVQDILIFASIRFFLSQGEVALNSLATIIGIELYFPQLLSWAQNIARERFNDPHAALLLLNIQLANKKYNEAIPQAQRMFEKFPESVDALIAAIDSVKPPPEIEVALTQILTDLYIKKGDFDRSIERLKRLKEKDSAKIDDVVRGLRELERSSPKNLKVLYALGDTYLETNKISLAINLFDKILEIDRNQYGEVIKRYKDAFEKEKNNPLVLQGLVSVLVRHNDVAAAVDAIESAYKSDPGFVDEYVINLNLALEKNLNNPKALYLLGLCLAHKGDHDNAVIIFDSLLAHNEIEYVSKATETILGKHPDVIQYLNLSARSLAMLGKEKEALTLFTQLLDKRPEEILNLLSTLDTVINKRPDLLKVVLPLYEKYRRVEPFVIELAIARAYAFAGENEKAVASFEKCLVDEKQRDTTKRALIEAIRERPKAVPLLLMAARVFLKEGEVDIATQFFKTAQIVDPKAFFEIIDEFYDVLKDFPKDREIWILLIEAFFNRRLWQRVIDETKRAIEVFGSDAQYFNLKLGQALVEIGNLSDAVRPLMLSLDGPADYSAEVVKYLDKILEIDKSNVPAHVARGRALSKAHRVEEAVNEFLITARIVPSRAQYILKELKILASKSSANPQIMFAMGKVELTLKNYEEAIKHLLQACELEVTLIKNVIPLLSKLSDEAPSPLLDFSLARTHQLADLKSAAVKFYIKAQAQDKAFREPAISELKKICRENPQDIESRKGLSQIYFDHNNLEDALDAMNEIYEIRSEEGNWAKNFISNILQKNPQHIPSYYFLSHILLNEKNYKGAIDIYKQLIEMSPTELTKIVNILEDIKDKNSDILLYLGTLYKNTGDVKKAIELFDKLFLMDTSFGEAIIYQIKEILMKNANLGEAYLLASKIFAFQKEYERAIDAIEHAQDSVADYEEIIIKKGQLYYEMGEVAKAIKIYSGLLEKSKSRKGIFRLLKKTRDDYYQQKIGVIKGDDDDARLQRAHMYLLINNVAGAEKELKFVPHNNLMLKYHTLLKARLYLRKSRPMDALEVMKNLPIDKDSAPIYADIYEAMGSYKAAAMVLRKSGIEGLENRIKNYEKLSEERRSVRGRYLIEGRI